MSTSCDVAIIGAGPTGLTLANLLGLRGLNVAVLERQPTPYDLPRAVHFDGECMRILQWCGLADAVLPDVLVGKGMLFQDSSGGVLVDWSRDQQIGPQGWHESYRCHQPALEDVLRKGLGRFADVNLRMGAEVTGLLDTGDGVNLSLAGGDSLRAAWVVGCDGAGSFTKGRIGATDIDLGFQERWLVVDLIATGKPADLGDYTIQFCDSERPATYVRGVGQRRRWEVRLKEGDRSPGSESEAWERLTGRVAPSDARMERFAVYTFRSAIATNWRKGRVLLAGDAAHQMPPFMGQGMCAGMRDAAALGWRLERAVAGTDESLLDSYETERAAHVRGFIDMSVRLGRLINQTAAGAAPKGRMTTPVPSLGQGLGGDHPLCGTLAPQARDALGERADDSVPGGGFHLLARDAVETALPVFSLPAELARDPALWGVLVRPDGYVLDMASNFEDVAVMLRRNPMTVRE